MSVMKSILKSVNKPRDSSKKSNLSFDLCLTGLIRWHLSHVYTYSLKSFDIPGQCYSRWRSSKAWANPKWPGSRSSWFRHNDFWQSSPGDIYNLFLKTNRSFLIFHLLWLVQAKSSPDDNDVKDELVSFANAAFLTLSVFFGFKCLRNLAGTFLSLDNAARWFWTKESTFGNALIASYIVKDVPT